MFHRYLLFALVLVAAGCGAAARGGQSATAPGVVAVPGATASSVATPAVSASAAPVASAPLAVPPTRPNRGSGPGGCFSRKELEARQDQAKTDNAATYVEALGRLGLQPVQLVSHRLVDGTSEIADP